MSGDDNSPWSYRVPGRGVDEAEEAGLRLCSGKENRAQARLRQGRLDSGRMRICLFIRTIEAFL